MISRTYICLLPNQGGVDLDIALQNAPGTQAAPVGTGGVAASAANGAYYELRGRPVRFEQLALLTGGGANPAFVRRARLGWRIAAYIWNSSVARSPSFLLSNSVVQSLVSTEGGTIVNPSTLADPGYGPTLRIINHADLATKYLFVHFDIMEAKDDDRDPNGSV